jgi:tetratricopeptide (TPR) repeat protein
LCLFQINEINDDERWADNVMIERMPELTSAENKEFFKSFLSSQNPFIHKAVICFDEAINLDQNNAELFSYKGQCLVKANKVEEACVQFKRSIEIEPENAYYKKLLNETQGN